MKKKNFCKGVIPTQNLCLRVAKINNTSKFNFLKVDATFKTL